MKPTQNPGPLRPQNDSVYMASHAKGLRDLLPLPASAAPSEFYQCVLKNSSYPPLLQQASMTLAAPFKEQNYCRSPSDSIGNNYSPAARDLKLKNLYKLKSSSMKGTSRRSAGQRTASPSSKCSDPCRKKLTLTERRQRNSDRITPTLLNSSDPISLCTPARMPELHVRHCTDDQPLTPEEQFAIIDRNEESKREKPPSASNIERYCYYIHNGVQEDMLAPQDKEMMNAILKRIPNHLLANPDLENLLANLEEEVKADYCISLKKSIVDYILMDPAERERLSIESIPRPFPWRVIRAPVPWHSSYKKAQSWIERNLFIVNPLMPRLHQLWLSEYSHLRFVRTGEMLCRGLPLLPTEFEEVIRRHCVEARNILQNKWIPTCASLFRNQKRKWLHFAPQKDSDSSEQVESYFRSVATLMSLQLREVVVNSLEDLLAFFMIHKDGNDFTEPYQQRQFFVPQILTVKLSVEEPKIVFEPPLKECWHSFSLSFREILHSAEELPKVERLLFPELKRDDLTLRTVKPDESIFSESVNKLEKVFESNIYGPQKYLNVYRKYSDLVNNNAQHDVIDFLKEGCSLEALREKIDSLTKLKREIASMHVTVPLAMFCLDAEQLNNELCNRTQNLKDRLIEFEVVENRVLNKRICNEYNLIAKRMSEVPLNTEELVEFDAYLKKFSEVTVFKLREDVAKAARRLKFLMVYADLSYDDIHLNSRVFHWCDQIEIIFENSREKLWDSRYRAEMVLLERCSQFEETLEGYNREVESYKKRDVMTIEEIKSNAEKLKELNKNLDNALTEFEAINKEEELLGQRKSGFPLLQTIIANKQPFEELWITAYNFHTKSEEWMNGSLQKLNADEITEEIGNMWRTMYKLSKSFPDLAGPRRLAGAMKNKLDKFKQHLPVLSIACNRGMKERHWEKISEIVGREIRPDETTTLKDILEFGLSKYIDQLEPVGTAASKEYPLEKSLQNMKLEWVNMQFSLVKYRDTNTSILSAVDDIQLLLDDHIVKTQTMCGSPFIKPIEAECRAWEDKLCLMKDILDSLLKCQAMWLHLEPIFSSEDIIAQMPEEGRKFGVVDSYWKDIMAHVVKNTKVLVATEHPMMLDRLQEANAVLEDIQKGLNTYLKKRSFFPRFFCLSDDELLETLSETKSPLVQPHLKKCFEGTAKLEFTEVETVGMISEKEIVPFIDKIYPADGKQVSPTARLLYPLIRCFWPCYPSSGAARILMGALELNLGGASEGPAGTSKTETINLAKALAKQCSVFNCSGGLDYKIMGKFFKGLAQSGAWCCFDNFNRIEVEVLSVVAQQVLSIQQAIIRKLKTLIFLGTEISLNAACAVFTTMNPGYAGRAELPDNLKALFQPVAMMVPDYALIGEISLYSMGFLDSKHLAQEIVATYLLCSEQLSSQHHHDYGIHAVKSVLTAAGNLKLKYPPENESVLLLWALLDVNSAKFLAEHVPLFQGIVSDLFPGVVLPTPDYDLFVKALTQNMEKTSLQPVLWFFGKIIQLYEMMLVRHGFMIVGDPLSGKTCAYKVLAGALGDLCAAKSMDEFAVEYKVINPKAIAMGQLYSSFDPVSQEWTDGVLANIFREQASSTTDNQKWIISDGPVDAVWIENMNTVLDDNKKLCLMSGEIIQMNAKMSLIFEPADLVEASPATVSRCGMIYMDLQELGWKPPQDSCMKVLPPNLQEEHQELANDLFMWLVQPCLEFIQVHCRAIVQTSSIQSHGLMKLYTCLLDKIKQSKEEEKENMSSQQIILWLQGFFLFALVWTVGGVIDADSRKKFDLFFCNLLRGSNGENPCPERVKLTRNSIFPEGSAYDLFNQQGSGQWNIWTEYITKEEQVPCPGANVSGLIIPTMETARQIFFLKTYVEHNVPLLFVGATSTGKSAVTNNFLLQLPKQKYIPSFINFSAGTSANQTQDIIMFKLDRRRKGLFGPPLGKKAVIFVDDLNMPAKEEVGAQPPIELLRQWIGHGHWYDRKDTSKIGIIDVLLVSAMGPPGGDRNDITGRFTWHLNIVSIHSFDDDILTRILTAVADWHFSKGFEPEFLRIGKIMVQATMVIYKMAVDNFLPTPSKLLQPYSCESVKSHYVFYLWDFSTVIKGVLLCPHTRLQDGDKSIRLWIHEVYRVFCDRLADEEHRKVFFQMVQETTSNSFKQSFNEVLSHLSPTGKISDDSIHNLFSGDYLKLDSNVEVYGEITDLNQQTTVMEHYLVESNSISKAPMSLVMFKFAVEHISRLCRVLKQDNGHLLLVGVSGSGRQSATKLATYMNTFELFQVEVTKSYGISEWKDVKRVMLRAGVGNKNVSFLLCDKQIKDEAFVEGINMLLSTGDVPNIFATDEKAEIVEKMQVAARMENREIEKTLLSMYSFFMERVKKNLHIVLTMTPTGDAFRNLQMVPSLINCCTIDWFQTWPSDALEMVANKFLEDVELEDDIRKEVVSMKYFQESVRELSISYYTTLQRHNYVTPSSYLELILTFKTLLNSKRQEVDVMRIPYLMGLQKLDFVSSQVAEMQKGLIALQPELIGTSAETEKMMIRIGKETAEVDAKKELVSADEKEANEAAAVAKAIKDECEGDLAEAVPALETAPAALDTLNPSDISLVKSMKNPPGPVKLVMENICVMTGTEAVRKSDPRESGKMIEDYWRPARKILGDLKFLQSLKTYDKDNIPPAVMKRIRERFIHHPHFQPAVIRVSSACEGLCKWMRAMEVYDHVVKVFARKHKRLRAAEALLNIQMRKLKTKQAELKEVVDHLQALHDEFNKMNDRKRELKNNIELCSQKLVRAEQLISGLGGDRWTEAARLLRIWYIDLTGDVLLSSGTVAYLGAFTADYRLKCQKQWKVLCNEKNILCLSDFSLSNTLGDPVNIHAWQTAGLAIDSFSTDNGIIVSNSRKWALMVDPQRHANKWVKIMEKTNRLSVIKLTDTYVKTLENAVWLGTPVLLENTGEELDAFIEPILLKLTFKQGVECIKLGENITEYSRDFRFYITTCLRNLHYLPEVAVKVCLLNITITPLGLQNQLLGIVTAKEKPELEGKKNKLIIEGAAKKKQLKEVEDNILEILSNSDRNIEDETGINILSSSKESEEISEKQKIASVTEVQIDSTRMGYKPVAIHSAVVFLCISDLANIEPMYHYSLFWFIHLYVQSIAKSKKSENLDKRIKNITEHFTISIYNNACHSLFEKDKLLFSFLLTASIMKEKDQIDDEVWCFLLTGGLALDNPHPNPSSDWLSDKSWAELVCASSLTNLHGLMEHVRENFSKWKLIYDCVRPHEEAFPDAWSTLMGLDHMVILRCLRPDKTIPTVQQFIVENMGRTFIEPPTLDLERSYSDSNCCAPLIFVLSGADPMADFVFVCMCETSHHKFADDVGMGGASITISLGQGQGPIAAKMIYQAVTDGTWVVLQNCHLATSWMPALEKICEEVMVPENTNDKFDMWLASYPSERFPVSILQNGIKMMNKPPEGFRVNLLQSYLNDPISDPVFFSSCQKPEMWQKLLFELCFFHAVVQERRNFGPLGWNIPYEFDDDLRTSMQQIQMFLNEYEEIPFEALTYLTGECNYGGRVTDDKDRCLLLSLISTVYSKDIEQDKYMLASGDDYYIVMSPHESYMEYLQSLLITTTHPEVFGLHENADITKENQETKQLFSGVLLTLPREAGGGVKPPQETGEDLAQDILSKLPSSFDVKEVMKVYPALYEESMNTVLSQELIQFNRLTEVVWSSLINLGKAIKGQVLMSSELEDVFNSMLMGKLPSMWAAKSHPSLKPLGSYVSDLLSRLAFFQDWFINGLPTAFWLSAFFFTQSFLTGVLNYARKYTIPIDHVRFEFEVMKQEHTMEKMPEDRAYVRGLFLEGGRWDKELLVTGESLPRILYDSLPIIWLKHRESSRVLHANIYSCPVYKTSARRGVLSTTGHSANYVLSIELPSDKPQKHWINRGVAALCQLDGRKYYYLPT
ncbi:LOW QUALITY PROTEIN: dynein axonemal heavy chain 3 [Rhynochetos jubatus]